LRAGEKEEPLLAAPRERALVAREDRLRLLWNLSRRGSRNRGRCERRVCGESIPPPVQRRGIRGWPVRWFRRLRCLEQAADNLQYRFIKKDSQREDSRKYECR